MCLLEFGLPGSELGLELADLLVRGVTRCRAGLVCVGEFGLELLSAVVVLRGLRGGDVDEGLEVGGGRCRLFGVLPEFGPQPFSRFDCCSCLGLAGREIGPESVDPLVRGVGRRRVGLA